MRAVCLGDPVTDLLSVTEKKYLKALNVTEGGCSALDQDEFKAFLRSLPEDICLKR